MLYHKNSVQQFIIMMLQLYFILITTKRSINFIELKLAWPLRQKLIDKHVYLHHKCLLRHLIIQYFFIVDRIQNWQLVINYV